MAWNLNNLLLDIKIYAGVPHELEKKSNYCTSNMSPPTLQQGSQSGSSMQPINAEFQAPNTQISYPSLTT